ncbi:DNA-binding protein [bacterium 336/3]|nr:DNA-binding protein [bacterium 336/3]
MEEYKETNDRAADVYSKRVRAGKRTYFFDVKSTRGSDFYLTITESKKRFRDNGFYYEKHKIFLYKEDFGKFIESLEEAIVKIKELMPDYDFNQVVEQEAFESNDEAQESELKWE